MLAEGILTTGERSILTNLQLIVRGLMLGCIVKLHYQLDASVFIRGAASSGSSLFLKLLDKGVIGVTGVS